MLVLKSSILGGGPVTAAVSRQRRMAKRSTKPKAFCFVLMPFDDAFNDVYQLGIKEACAQSSAYCERVDEQIFHESILERIFNQISKADLIIADMTGRNPNVFYEVGYAHALGKRAILLTKNADDIPFDLKHFPHIVYGDSITSLREDLAGRVKWFVDNPPSVDATGTIDIDLYLGDESLSKGGVTYTCQKDTVVYPKLTIHNASSKTFEPGAFKLGLITDGEHSHCRGEGVTSSALPNGQYLHMFPFFDTLFPNEYTSYQVAMNDAPGTGHKYELTFRVFTDAGTRDFSLTALPHVDG